MFADALGWPEPDWLGEARTQWAQPPPAQTTNVVIPIWRDPWMVVGRSTFTGDLAARIGLAQRLRRRR